VVCWSQIPYRCWESWLVRCQNFEPGVHESLPLPEHVDQWKYYSVEYELPLVVGNVSRKNLFRRLHIRMLQLQRAGGAHHFEYHPDQLVPTTTGE